MINIYQSKKLAAPAQAGAHCVCQPRTADAIGSSLRWSSDAFAGDVK
jgi:hypothetical protein